MVDFFLDMRDDFLDFVDDVRDGEFTLKDIEIIQWAAVIIVIVCLIGTFVTCSSRSKATDAFEGSLQDNDKQIAELTSRLEGLKGENNDRANPNEVRTMLKSAVSAGNAVAALQTAYQDCMAVDFEAGETVEAKLSKNAADIEAYLSEEAKGARVPWFMETAGSATSSRLTWKFMTNYSFSSDSVEVLWVCRDRSDMMVAYATGTYDARTELFSNVQYFATAYGNQTYRQPEDQMAVYAESLDDSPSGVIEAPRVEVPPSNADNALATDPETGVPENWAEEFNDEFKASKEYREWRQAQLAEANANANKSS